MLKIGLYLTSSLMYLLRGKTSSWTGRVHGGYFYVLREAFAYSSASMQSAFINRVRQ